MLICHLANVSILVLYLFIYFFLYLTSLSTLCIGYITPSSFMGRGNQYILVGQDSFDVVVSVIQCWMKKLKVYELLN